jgi:Arc/MetJ-type ribon-helix-helix transcriptional regulator
MPTRKITLTDVDERLVAAQIKAGRGKSVSDVVSAGLLLLIEAEAVARAKRRR